MKTKSKKIKIKKLLNDEITNNWKFTKDTRKKKESRPNFLKTKFKLKNGIEKNKNKNL
jgi:demethoxyubiquinone hydroxylase (CLK1/Coq7/Cat5 family)